MAHDGKGFGRFDFAVHVEEEEKKENELTATGTQRKGERMKIQHSDLAKVWRDRELLEAQAFVDTVTCLVAWSLVLTIFLLIAWAW